MRAEELDDWMSQMGFTGESLAALTGMTSLTISQYRRGKKNIPLKARLAFAAIQAGLDPVGSDYDEITSLSCHVIAQRYWQTRMRLNGGAR